LRFVSQNIGEATGRRIVIGTTSIISGDRAVGFAEETRKFGE
jgi:hypothetical protein